MSIVTRRVSDLSGAEAADDAFVTVIVRKDDRIETPVQLDALASEVSGLESAEKLTHLQIKTRGGQSWEIICNQADFDALAQDGRKMDEVLGQLPGTKGRPKGSRNLATSNGNSA